VPSARTALSAHPFTDSAYVWAEGLPAARNQFVSFELRFDSAALSGEAKRRLPLHLFADTRYRLWLNERFVAHGPARFVNSHPEYDSHDLAPLLRPGPNLLRVEVNHFGASSFQTMPGGAPGFIAAGGDPAGAVNFATPGAWRARPHRAWAPDAPAFGFAQGPVEVCDTRRLATELGASAAVLPLAPLPASARPWPLPSPRSVPRPDFHLVAPARVLATGPLLARRRWAHRYHHAGFVPLLRGDEPISHGAFVGWIHSPRVQLVRLDAFWGDITLNGEPLALRPGPLLGNHHEAEAPLRAGWNHLAGRVALLAEHWTLLLGLPADCDATLHARPDLAETDALFVSPPLAAAPLAPPPADPAQFAPPAGWAAANGAPETATPARLVAWDQPDPARVLRQLPLARLAECSTHEARAAFWCFDFGDEFHGHPVLEVEAPAGSILDIACDDWARADGCVNLYHSNPFTDAAERFILRGGRQRVELFHARGGIYLQAVLRVPPGAAPAPLTLHSVQVRRRTTLHDAREAAFTCGDPIIDWAWERSLHTLRASTDEAYVDCPWRERGSYIADTLVSLHLHALTSADLSIARRTLANFARARLPDGQLPPCAPAWLRRPHPDFSLLWIVALRDYWALSGDRAFVLEHIPVALEILSSPFWRADADGLWDSTGQNLFIDWGVLRSEREGSANAVLNLFRVAALRALAELAPLHGSGPAAQAFCPEAERVLAALRLRLWREDEGRFLASTAADTPALHANILALALDAAPAAPLLAWLEPRLRANLRKGREQGEFSGHAELYFFFHLLPVLARHGRHDLAELVIRETYGHLREIGLPTLPEAFCHARHGRGSACHTWSGAAALYASEEILGLRRTVPGDPSAWLLDPRSPHHTSAAGAVATPFGPLRVSWRREDASIRAMVEAPPGVKVSLGAAVSLRARLRIRAAA
jgi:hypothetical protein